VAEVGADGEYEEHVQKAVEHGGLTRFGVGQLVRQ